MSNRTPAEPCQFLEWDSNFFGLKIGRLNLARLTVHQMPAILKWCRQQRIDCLYFLADANHPATIELAAKHGFDLVDVRITLEHRGFARSEGPIVANDAVIRDYRPADLAALREMAGRLHQDTRFFFDRRFRRPRSQELYRIWLERSCGDLQGRVFVAESNHRPAGYIGCSIDGAENGKIELVGVEQKFQGRGVGRQMVSEALRWLEGRGARKVSVVTQGRNVAAQRLYQRAGFVTQSLQLWYHRWFKWPPQNQKRARAARQASAPKKRRLKP